MSRQNWTSEKLFQRLLTNTTESSFWKNMSVLRSRPNEEVYNRAYSLANSDQLKEQLAGIYVLAQLGFNPRFQQAKTVALYFQLLKTATDEEVLEALLSSIGHNNEALTTNQVQALLPFAKHEFYGVRHNLVFALGGQTHESAIATMITLTHDTSSSVRNWATFSLGTLIENDSPAIREALWKRAHDVHEETKLEAILGLANRNDSRVKQCIQKQLELGTYGTLLFDAIAILQADEFLPILKKELITEKENKDVNPDWLTALKTLIATLENHSEQLETN